MAITSEAAIVYIGIAATVMVAVTWKWVLFGIKLQIKTLIWKRQNVALGLIRNLGNNIGIPQILHIKDNKESSNDKLQMYDRAMFTEGTLFGFPYAIFDSEDTKSTYGIYAKIKNLVQGKPVPGVKYQYCKAETNKDGQTSYTPISYNEYKLHKVQVDDEGHIITHKLETKERDPNTNEPVLYDTGIPVLRPLKRSVTVSPHLMKTVIAAAALSKAIEEFVKKNQMIMYLAGGACLAGIAAAFFAYNNQNSISQLCAVQLPTIKDAITQSCTQLVQNISR